MDIEQAIRTVCLSGPRVLNGIAPTQAALDSFTCHAVDRWVWRNMSDFMGRHPAIYTPRPAPAFTPLDLRVDVPLISHTLDNLKGNHYLTFHRNKHRPVRSDASQYYVLSPTDPKLFE